MTKDTFYFSHDSNARNDIKIVKLRRALGLEGYAIYFCLIELLREQSNFKLPMESIPDIAFDLHTSEEKVKTVILSFDLFQIDEDNFFSNRLMRSMITYVEKKNKLSEAGKKGNEKRWLEHNRNKFLSGGDSGSDPNLIALKKSKENKSKENNENIVGFDKQTPTENDLFGNKIASAKMDIEVKANNFVEKFNGYRKNITGVKGRFTVTDKIKKSLNARLKKYNESQIWQVVKKSHAHDIHIKQKFQYLTPSYVLREEILERYLNQLEIKHV